MSKVKLILDVVQDMRTLADSIQAVAIAFLQNAPPEQDTEVEPAKTEKQEQKQLTIEEVRAVLRSKIEEKGKDAVQKLLRKYGSALLSEIDPKLYADLVADAGFDIGHTARLIEALYKNEENSK